MVNVKTLFGRILKCIRKNTFSNIAEGTHAGSVTMTAGESIDTPHLIVAVGSFQNEIVIAGATSKPVGVCDDCGAEGERLPVILGGCSGSTLMCVSATTIEAGDSLYTADSGKVSNVAADGSYKIGVALCPSSAGCVVEVDPQGFGTAAFRLYAGGIYAWQGSDSAETLEVNGLSSADIVFASLQESSSGVSSVKASAGDGGINFTLNAAGSAGTEKIVWMVIRKN